jgi:hypothetical protein
VRLAGYMSENVRALTLVVLSVMLGHDHVHAQGADS